MKLRSLVIVTILAAIILPPLSVIALSDSQRGTISQNCASMQQSLKALQKADSRTRAHLGSTYETVLNKFMTPLNIRLAKDNQPNPELAAVQSEFASLRTKFSQQFVKYSQSLEELISLDCRTQPEAFHKRLGTTRKLRHKLSMTVAELHRLVENHQATVKNLQEYSK